MAMPRFRSALSLVVIAAAVGCENSTPNQWRSAPTGASGSVVAVATPSASAPVPVMRRKAEAKVVVPTGAAAAGNDETWGEDKIAWRTPEAGLAEAARDHKPMMVVIYANWCPHCRNYSKVFDDLEVANASKKFVMIKANSEEAESFAAKYAPDGSYIPRTLFLNADGSIKQDVRAQNPRFAYFYDEHDPKPLLAAMSKAVGG
jgi:protein-disulfide reductase (glutathione)